MKLLQLLFIAVILTFTSCQSNTPVDTSDAEKELQKEKEALLNEREKLLNEREQMMEESKNEKTTKESPSNSSTSARFKDQNGNPCVVGETYMAEIKDKDGYTNVRKSPSNSAQIVTQINEGESFAVTITNDKWLRVNAPDGTQGYIFWDRVRVIGGIQ
jgi:hypothetical protein